MPRNPRRRLRGRCGAKTPCAPAYGVQALSLRPGRRQGEQQHVEAGSIPVGRSAVTMLTAVCCTLGRTDCELTRPRVRHVQEVGKVPADCPNLWGILPRRAPSEVWALDVERGPAYLAPNANQ